MILIILVALVLVLALSKAAHAHTGHEPPRAIAAALRRAEAAYGVPYRQLLAVSRCESGWDARAWNPTPVGPAREHSQGLFGFLPSTWRLTPYRRRSMFDPVAAALAAAWLVRQDGSWREWVCRP